MTDSWSERPIPTEPADPQAVTRRVPQGGTPDSAVPAPARMPSPGQAANKADGKGKSRFRGKNKGKSANVTPFVWDSGLTVGPGPGDPPPEWPEPQPGPLPPAPWIGVPGQTAAGGGGADGSLPPEGPRGGSGGRGTRLGLVLVGSLAVAGLLVWVIVSALPNNAPKAATVAADSTADASPSSAVQPLGASASPSVSVSHTTAKASPSAAKATHSAAPRTTQPQQPVVAKTTQAPTAAASTAAVSAPSTVDVAIADSEDGLVLDVDNSGTSAGTLVGTWSVDNTAAQHWHLVPQTNGTYVIYSELADLKVGLEINTDANDFSGDTITTLQSYTGDTSMQWTAKYLGSNKYELISSYNGQCLTGGGRGVANATAACDTSDAHQAWTITG